MVNQLNSDVNSSNTSNHYQRDIHTFWASFSIPQIIFPMATVFIKCCLPLLCTITHLTHWKPCKFLHNWLQKRFYVTARLRLQVVVRRDVAYYKQYAQIWKYRLTCDITDLLLKFTASCPLHPYFFLQFYSGPLSLDIQPWTEVREENLWWKLDALNLKHLDNQQLNSSFLSYMLSLWDMLENIGVFSHTMMPHSSVDCFCCWCQFTPIL